MAGTSPAMTNRTVADEKYALTYSAATRRAPRTPSDSDDTRPATALTVPGVALPPASRLVRTASTRAEPTTTPSAFDAISRALAAVFTPKPTATGSLVWRLILVTASATRLLSGVAEPVMPVIET